MSVALPLMAACGFGKDEAPHSAPVAAECPAVRAAADKGQLRGVWISTVQNIDWPSRAGLSATRQRAEYRSLLDRARARGINAVFVQVRPAADAFYPSPDEPWSEWLTGKQGRSPGYDPLKFLVSEARGRGMQFHAWFNPYRVAKQPDIKKLAASSPARKNPSWVRRHGRALWYDPGMPEVRDLAAKSVLDVVRRYDIDGVHFDDYFYPYPIAGKDFADGASFKKYGSGKSRADWRRANVNTLIERLSREIRQAKPHVSFGISPFGVWRNKTADPAGSSTKALQSYDEIYADTRTWIKKGWLDYVAPQLYWNIGYRAADYRVLVAWWNRQVAGTRTQLYIGQGAYRVGSDKPWKDPAELSRHVRLNAKYSNVRGDIYFSVKSLVGNKLKFADRLRRDHYSRPALPPVIPRMAAGQNTAAPSGLKASGESAGVRLRWPAAAGTSYAIYRTDGRRPACAAIDPRRLIATARSGEAIDRTAKPGTTYTYYIAALDRAQRQSPPSRGATVTGSRG